MDEFFRETLFDPAWWFTAIFIGLIISIVGNKLTDPASNLLGKMYRSVRERNEAYKLRFEKRVTSLVENSEREIIVRIERSYYHQKASMESAIALFFMVFGIIGAIAYTFIISSIFWIADLLESPDADLGLLTSEETLLLFFPFVILVSFGVLYFIAALWNNWKLLDLEILLREVDKRHKESE